MTILWDEELPACDGVRVNLLCLAEAAMLADLWEIVRGNLRRLASGLSAGLAGAARAMGG